MIHLWHTIEGILIFIYLFKVQSCFLNEISGLSFKYKTLSFSTCQKDNYFYQKTTIQDIQDSIAQKTKYDTF